VAAWSLQQSANLLLNTTHTDVAVPAQTGHAQRDLYLTRKHANANVPETLGVIRMSFLIERDASAYVKGCVQQYTRWTSTNVSVFATEFAQLGIGGQLTVLVNLSHVRMQ